MSLFFSDRAYPSGNFLLPLSLLDPYSDYVEINISLNESSSLSFLDVYAPSICFSPKDSRTNFFSFSILPLPVNFFILGNCNCHHSLKGSKGTSDHGEEVFDCVFSSDIPLFHRSSGSRSYPYVFFPLLSLALSCSSEVLQDLGSDHLLILQTVPFSPVFRPN